MNLTVGCEEVESCRAAMAPLDGLEPLQKFVLAYANVSPNGGRLTERSMILEGVLFAVWLEACSALGLSAADPNRTAGGTPL